MAAVIDIQTGLGIADPSGNGGSGRTTPLRVIEGGRSAEGLRLRRTYFRRRVLAVVVVLFAVFCLAKVAGAAVESFSTTSSPVAPLTGESYRVAPGDTLWGIADRLDPDADPRGTVDRLIQANPGAVSADGVLRSGQVLVLPRA